MVGFNNGYVMQDREIRREIKSEIRPGKMRYKERPEPELNNVRDVWRSMKLITEARTREIGMLA